VYKHSGLRDPQIRIDFSIPQKDKIRMVFESRVNVSETNLNNISQRSNEAALVIKNGGPLPQNKTEGNSGIIKIASTARLSGGDIICFGLSSDKNWYQVELELGLK
jgi:hypothetical protein